MNIFNQPIAMSIEVVDDQITDAKSDPRFPLGTPKPTAESGKDVAGTKPEWVQIPGAPLGVEINRDGKTMRNRPPGSL